MLFSKKSREDDGLKTGEGVNVQAQKIADAMVARKMRGISKEELAMFKQYKEEFLEFLQQKGIEPETGGADEEKTVDAAQIEAEAEKAAKPEPEETAQGEAADSKQKEAASEPEQAEEAAQDDEAAEGKQDEAPKPEESEEEAVQNEQEEAGAQAVMLAAQAGFLPERLEDAVVLVLAKVRSGMSAEEAVEAVAGANPAWTRGELPSRGGNPAKKRAVRKESPKVI